jgi:hypothetical protein
MSEAEEVYSYHSGQKLKLDINISSRRSRSEHTESMDFKFFRNLTGEKGE